MEPSLIRYIISMLLIALGVFYFMKPEKGASFLGYAPKYVKYVGLIIIALGVYYILVMLGLLPMFSYWE